MRTGLPEDPAVSRMAAALRIEDDAVVGKLHRLWAWATTNLVDGNAAGVTDAWVDRYVKCDGFARMLCAEGWLRVSPEGLTFPNWDRYLSEGSKHRALTARRVASHRESGTESVTEEKQKCNAPSVTGSISISTSNSPSSSSSGSLLPPEDTKKAKPTILSLSDALKIPPPIEWGPDLIAVWGRFIEDRYARGKKMTVNAIDELMIAINQMPKEDRHEAVSQSIANGWTGIFPIQRKTNGTGNNGNVRRGKDRSGEYAEPAITQLLGLPKHLRNGNGPPVG